MCRMEDDRLLKQEERRGQTEEEEEDRQTTWKNGVTIIYILSARWRQTGQNSER